MKFHLNRFNGCQLTEWIQNSIANDQREINTKISKAELWFLCMTHRLIVLYNCMKFHFYNFNGCQLTEQTRNSIANDQWKITPKISKAELWFLCMTHRLIMLYNCMEFQPNSFDGCQLTDRTRNNIPNDQREITPKYPKQSYGSQGSRGRRIRRPGTKKYWAQMHGFAERRFHACKVFSP